MLKQYFKYLAFLEACWHSSVYPNYQYKPRKKMTSPKTTCLSPRKNGNNINKRKPIKKRGSKPTQFIDINIDFLNTSTALNLEYTASNFPTIENTGSFLIGQNRGTYDLDFITTDLMKHEQLYFGPSIVENQYQSSICKPHQAEDFHDTAGTLNYYYEDIIRDVN